MDKVELKIVLDKEVADKLTKMIAEDEDCKGLSLEEGIVKGLIELSKDL